MSLKTLEGMLFPDGTVTLPAEELPTRPVRILVTLLEGGDEALLSELGDYEQQLADYEERLARGEIQWQ